MAPPPTVQAATPRVLRAYFRRSCSCWPGSPNNFATEAAAIFASWIIMRPYARNLQPTRILRAAQPWSAVTRHGIAVFPDAELSGFDVHRMV